MDANLKIADNLAASGSPDALLKLAEHKLDSAKLFSDKGERTSIDLERAWVNLEEAIVIMRFALNATVNSSANVVSKSPFAAELHRLRESNHYTFRKLEEITGVSSSLLHSLESGRTLKTKDETIKKLEKAYQLPEGTLLELMNISRA